MNENDENEIYTNKEKNIIYQETKNKNCRRQNRREANKSKHRLLSIFDDVLVLAKIFKQHLGTTSNPKEGEQAHSKDVISSLISSVILSSCLPSWPIIPNERCGTWYAYPFVVSQRKQQNKQIKSCYFKSTDGHYGTWNFSLQRLNLGFLEYIAGSNNRGGDGGCYVVDSSSKRIMPDSMSRTIPIWCCVLNLLAIQYHQINSKHNEKLRLSRRPVCCNKDIGGAISNNDGSSVSSQPEEDSDDEEFLPVLQWTKDLLIGDTSTQSSSLLFTPPDIITKEEHDTIFKRIKEVLVPDVLSKKCIDKKWLVTMLQNRPLRPYWIVRTKALGSDGTPNINNNCISGDENFENDEVVSLLPNDEKLEPNKFICIVCISCSFNDKNTKPPTLKGIKAVDSKSDENREDNYWYTPGAANDHELWANGLTPKLFWKFCRDILFDGTGDMTNISNEMKTKLSLATKIATVQMVDKRIGALVQKERNRSESAEESYLDESTGYTFNDYFFDDDVRDSSRYDYAVHFRTIVGGSCARAKAIATKTPISPQGVKGGRNDNRCCSISIGTRKSGKPAICWEYFDCIVNVTMMEYMDNTHRAKVPHGKYYLQLPVQEGKKDRSELERWLSVALAFIGIHLNDGIANKRPCHVLIHCAQGMDRSVAVAMATVSLFYDINVDKESNDLLTLHPWCNDMTIESLANFISRHECNSLSVASALSSPTADFIDQQPEGGDEYFTSGLDKKLVNLLLGRDGRDLFFNWIHYLQAAYSESPKSKHESCPENSSQTAGCENLVLKSPQTSLLPTKSSLRLTLNIIQRYHDKANPSRNTMQKLNRYFMSNLQ